MSKLLQLLLKPASCSLCRLLILFILPELKKAKYSSSFLLHSTTRSKGAPVAFPKPDPGPQNHLEEQFGVFTALNLTFTNLQTVLYQNTPGEQNCFVWPVFSLSLYLQPSTVVDLFLQDFPLLYMGYWAFLSCLHEEKKKACEHSSSA